MDLYVIARLVHILSACVLFGSGAAIAFFMLMAWRSGGRAGFALVARHVVLADWLFTASAVVIQPLSGIALAHLAGWPLTAPWLLASYGLYGFIGACWLPVVGIQIRIRDMARQAVLVGQPRLPQRVMELYRIWFALGFPAFAGVLGILWLMLTTPEL
jgi:uncharacterized membrane protein